MGVAARAQTQRALTYIDDRKLDLAKLEARLEHVEQMHAMSTSADEAADHADFEQAVRDELHGD